MSKKPYALIVIGIAAVFLLASPVVWAQPETDEEDYDTPTHGMGMMPSDQMGQMGPTDRAGMTAQMSADNLKRRLGLTDDQVVKIKELRRNYLKETVMQTAKIRVAELELSDLLDEKKLDAAKIEKKVKELESLRSELTLTRVRSLLKSAEFLTPEQFAQFRAMTLRRMGAPGMGGPMGRMEKGKMGPPSESGPRGGQGMMPGMMNPHQ